MKSHFQSSEATWTRSGFTVDTIGLRGLTSCEPTHATPPTRNTVMAGIDQTSISRRPEYAKFGRYRARSFDARNQKATPSVARITGITIASMMPSELSRICRSAPAIGPFGSSTPSVQLACEQKENRPADRDDHAIDRPCKPEHPGQLRGESQEAAVDQDLPCRCSLSRNHRQHGNAGTGVVIGAIERESPEMGRRPKEDNEEQRKRLEPDVSGCSGPSDHGRQRSCSAADDDVLSRSSLQPRRVHDNIKEDGAGQQCGCCEVRRQSQNHHCETAKKESKDKRLEPGDLAAGNWPHRGAAHDRIDIGVVPHVEHAGGSSPGGNGNNRGKSS